MLIFKTFNRSKLELLKKINSSRTHLIEFHDNYVKGFENLSADKHFHKMRLFYLNKIREEYGEFFQDERIIHILTNLLQVCFILFKEINIDQTIQKFFDYFLLASMFLVIKLEFPNLFKRLKVKACDMGLDLEGIYDTEKVILSKLGWKFNISTPAEIKLILLSLIEDNKDEDADGFINDVINFSLHEYAIYAKYDQLIITLGAIKFCYLHFGKSLEFIENIIIELNLDTNELERFRLEIIELMFKEDSDVEKSDQKEIYNGNNNLFGSNDVNINLNNYENSFDFGYSSASTVVSFNLEEVNDLFDSAIKSEDTIIKERSESFLRKKRIGKCFHHKKMKIGIKSKDRHNSYNKECVTDYSKNSIRK